MNKKDYATREVAILLRDSGYDIPSENYYKKDSVRIFKSKWLIRNKHIYGVVECAAPSLSDAQKWLREKFGLHIKIDYESSQLWGFTIYNINIDCLEDTDSMFNSYEEALNKGIKEALKLI